MFSTIAAACFAVFLILQLAAVILKPELMIDYEESSIKFRFLIFSNLAYFGAFIFGESFNFLNRISFGVAVACLVVPFVWRIFKKNPITEN